MWPALTFVSPEGKGHGEFFLILSRSEMQCRPQDNRKKFPYVPSGLPYLYMRSDKITQNAQSVFFSFFLKSAERDFSAHSCVRRPYVRYGWSRTESLSGVADYCTRIVQYHWLGYFVLSMRMIDSIPSTKLLDLAQSMLDIFIYSTLFPKW